MDILLCTPSNIIIIVLFYFILVKNVPVLYTLNLSHITSKLHIVAAFRITLKQYFMQNG